MFPVIHYLTKLEIQVFNSLLTVKTLVLLKCIVNYERAVCGQYVMNEGTLRLYCGMFKYT
jgi:hypothetical protein